MSTTRTRAAMISQQARRAPPSCANMLTARSFKLLLVMLSALVLILLNHSNTVQGFIKFGYILNTTACDTCDELRTYSGRNVFCCLAQSKCCGPNSLDELDALTTTQLPLNP